MSDPDITDPDPTDSQLDRCLLDRSRRSDAGRRRRGRVGPERARDGPRRATGPGRARHERQRDCRPVRPAPPQRRADGAERGDRPHPDHRGRDAAAARRLGDNARSPRGRTGGLLVNGTPIARGEVVVVDEQFGLRVTQIGDGEPAPDTPAQAPEQDASAGDRDVGGLRWRGPYARSTSPSRRSSRRTSAGAWGVFWALLRGGRRAALDRAARAGGAARQRLEPADVVGGTCAIAGALGVGGVERAARSNARCCSRSSCRWCCSRWNAYSGAAPRRRLASGASSEIDWGLTRGLLEAIVSQLALAWRDLGGLELTFGQVDLEGDAGVFVPIGEPTFSLDAGVQHRWTALEHVAADAVVGDRARRGGAARRRARSSRWRPARALGDASAVSRAPRCSCARRSARCGCRSSR